MGLFDDIKDKLTKNNGDEKVAPQAPVAPDANAAAEMQQATDQAAAQRAAAERATAQKAEEAKAAADKAAADAKAAADKAAAEKKAAADKAAAAKKAAEQRTYTVKSGDTLSEIALKHGVKNYMDLAKANKIANPDLIHPGQVLVIPG